MSVNETQIFVMRSNIFITAIILRENNVTRIMTRACLIDIILFIRNKNLSFHVYGLIKQHRYSGNYHNLYHNGSLFVFLGKKFKLY